MTKLQKIILDKITNTLDYVNRINVFGHPAVETVDGIEVYKDTGNVCSVDLKKKQLHDDAMMRWLPVVEKIAGTSNPGKNAILAEYAQAQYDAIHSHDMPQVLTPKKDLEFFPSSLKIYAMTHLNNDFIGVVKPQDIDKKDINVDDHF